MVSIRSTGRQVNERTECVALQAGTKTFIIERHAKTYEPSDCRWLPPLMDTRNSQGVTDALPSSLRYLMEGKWATGTLTH
ncbi:hypothetical protein EVAR_82772_1 [Eumeta japonica]|uniref:Uncharacterized protein n=1 Tax=Eumeta variegata TaxID=151549 RepID=A0A4C1UPG0_EUMVA|nr:hypothetical protein EVAR_82772_1 [Eumeta japonica]